MKTEASHTFKEGDHVLFKAWRGYPEQKLVGYGGVLSEKLGVNLWIVVGHGFTARVTEDEMTLNPNFHPASAAK